MALYINSHAVTARVINAPDDPSHGKTNIYTVREFDRDDGTKGKMLKMRIGFEANPNAPVRPGADRVMTFIDMVIWGGIVNSPRVHEYFAKGAMVSIANMRLTPNDWETREGEKRYGYQFEADQNTTIVPHALLNSNVSIPPPENPPTTASATADMESDAIPF